MTTSNKSGLGNQLKDIHHVVSKDYVADENKLEYLTPLFEYHRKHIVKSSISQFMLNYTQYKNDTRSLNIFCPKKIFEKIKQDSTNNIKISLDDKNLHLSIEKLSKYEVTSGLYACLDELKSKFTPTQIIKLANIFCDNNMDLRKDRYMLIYFN